MANNIYQSFRSFLRQNDCEKQFDAAFYTQCGANYLDETLAGILVIDEFFFGRCFDWSKAPEGREFWEEVNRRWWKLLDLKKTVILPLRTSNLKNVSHDWTYTRTSSILNPSVY